MDMRFLALVALAMSAQPSLAKLALLPSQVGPGYVLQQRTDGQGLAQRTLDLCGTKNYPSEALRVGRLQVDYLRQNAQLALSNEVVAYKGSGAADALREAAQHAATCPKTAFAFEGAPPLRYQMTRIHDAKLLKGYVAVRVHRTGTVNGKRVNDFFFVVYQRIGNVLSGVYSYPLTTGITPAEQEAFCLHAAEQSAGDLRAGVKPPAGGVPA